MPKVKDATTVTSGAMETAIAMLLSQAVKQFQAKQLDDAIVIVIPDTGKAKFSPSHEILTGKQAGKMSKATFVVAELGSSFSGEPLGFTQSQGDIDGLPLSVKLSVIATPPNKDGKTIDEALNRKVDAVPSDAKAAQSAATN